MKLEVQGPTAPNVEVIDVRGNLLTHEGIIEILKHYVNLQALCVADGKLEYLEPIAEVIKTKPLLALGLGGNYLKKGTVKRFLQAVKGSKLEVLGLSGVALDDQAVK